MCLCINNEKKILRIIYPPTKIRTPSNIWFFSFFSLLMFKNIGEGHQYWSDLTLRMMWCCSRKRRRRIWEFELYLLCFSNFQHLIRLSKFNSIDFSAGNKFHVMKLTNWFDFKSDSRPFHSCMCEILKSTFKCFHISCDLSTHSNIELTKSGCYRDLKIADSCWSLKTILYPLLLLTHRFSFDWAWYLGKTYFLSVRSTWVETFRDWI